MTRLSGALWWQGGKRKESLQLHLWNLNPCPILLWLPVDWALRFLLISVNWKRAWTWTNIEKHVPRVMMPLLMTSLPISISHWLFRCRYSNSRSTYIVASSSSFSRPTTRAPQRACLQAIWRVLMQQRAYMISKGLNVKMRHVWRWHNFL